MGIPLEGEDGPIVLVPLHLAPEELLDNAGLDAGLFHQVGLGGIIFLGRLKL